MNALYWLMEFLILISYRQLLVYTPYPFFQKGITSQPAYQP